MQEQKLPKKKNKHQQKPQYKNLNPFKQLEKHFKLYQNQETDFSIVYQPEKYQNLLGYNIAFLPYPQGGIIVRDFNPPNIVFDIALNALNVYCQKPYRTNLDSRQDLYTQKKQEINESAALETEEVKSGVKDKGNIQQNVIKEDVNAEHEQAGIKQEKGYIFNDKVRWANVGYQYDWTQRKYPNVKTVIPQQIGKLCDRANKIYNHIKNENKNYYPESAIINYYGQKDYMTGHLDDAEIDKISPIYSFCFGLSCIFLIGGMTKQTKPIAIRLNSGDLFIMGGESRQCYHGVPRILAKTYIPPKDVKADFLKEWKNDPVMAQNYLLTHRININVRQVYPTED